MADVNLSLDILREVQEITTHRIKRFGFGDGYEQIAVDGVNSRITEYSITTRPLSSADSQALRRNLDKVIKGDYFVATLSPYSSQARRYRLADPTYQRKMMATGDTFRETLVFTLQEAYAG